MDRALFKKRGIDVEYTQVGNVGTLPPVLGKSFDIGFIPPTSAINAAANGISTTQIAGAYTCTEHKPDNFLMVAKNSDIMDVSQLKGKTIGSLSIAGTLDLGTKYMLKKKGVPPSSVKVIQVPGQQMAAQLKSGRVAAVEAALPFSAQIEASGGRTLAIPYKSIGKKVTGIYWAADTTWAARHPQTVRLFQKVLKQGIQFIERNPDAATEILQKYTKLPRSVARESIAGVEFSTQIRKQDFPKWLKVMRTVGDFNKDVDLSNMTFQR